MLDPNEQYDLRRCRTCGRAWNTYYDEITCRIVPGHPVDSPCNGARPAEPLEPIWPFRAPPRTPLRAATASNPPATVDDSAKARREVSGGVPTREWVGADRADEDAIEVNRDADCITVREWAERVPIPESPTDAAETEAMAVSEWLVRHPSTPQTVVVTAEAATSGPKHVPWGVARDGKRTGSGAMEGDIRS